MNKSTSFLARPLPYLDLQSKELLQDLERLLQVSNVAWITSSCRLSIIIGRLCYPSCVTLPQLATTSARSLCNNMDTVCRDHHECETWYFKLLLHNIKNVVS